MKQYNDEEISKIKEAAETILEIVKNSPGTSSWLQINDIHISCDIGYVLEFCEKVISKL